MTALSPPRASRSPGNTEPDPTAPPRTIRSRRDLPGGRAVAGGLLVAIAAVGIFAAYQGAGTGTGASYVVVAEDLPIGTPLTDAMLDLAPVDLPGAMAARAYRDPAELVGQVTVAPLAEGDLVQASSVVEGSAGEAVHELSFGLDTDRVVNGRLDPGERVDVAVTYGSGTDAYTEAVVSAARVVAVDGAGGGTLGPSDRTVLTLAVPQAADVLALTHAVRAGEVTVIRSTFAPPAAIAPGPYRPGGGGGGTQGGEAGPSAGAPG